MNKKQKGYAGNQTLQPESVSGKGTWQAQVYLYDPKLGHPRQRHLTT